jgi:hypothetical protein
MTRKKFLQAAERCEREIVRLRKVLAALNRATPDYYAGMAFARAIDHIHAAGNCYRSVALRAPRGSHRATRTEHR